MKKVSTLIGYLLGCYALHYGIMYVSILYTLYIQIVC